MWFLVISSINCSPVFVKKRGCSVTFKNVLNSCVMLSHPWINIWIESIVMLRNVLDPQPYLYKPSMLPDVESSLVAGIARQISIKVYATEYKTSTLQQPKPDKGLASGFETYLTAYCSYHKIGNQKWKTIETKTIRAYAEVPEGKTEVWAICTAPFLGTRK